MVCMILCNMNNVANVLLKKPAKFRITNNLRPFLMRLAMSQYFVSSKTLNSITIEEYPQLSPLIDSYQTTRENETKKVCCQNLVSR